MNSKVTLGYQTISGTTSPATSTYTATPCVLAYTPPSKRHMKIVSRCLSLTDPDVEEGDVELNDGSITFKHTTASAMNTIYGLQGSTNIKQWRALHTDSSVQIYDGWLTNGRAEYSEGQPVKHTFDIVVTQIFNDGFYASHPS